MERWQRQRPGLTKRGNCSITFVLAHEAAVRETPGAFFASSRLDRVPPAALDAKYACRVVNRSETRRHTFLGDGHSEAQHEFTAIRGRHMLSIHPYDIGPD